MTAKNEKLPILKCICPSCEETHFKSIRWAGGNITPRIYCDECKVKPVIKTATDDLNELRVLYDFRYKKSH